MAARSVLLSLLVALSATSGIIALPHRNHDHDHDHAPIRARLPGDWFHDPTHEAVKLFRRQDGRFPEIGSPEWTSRYPPSKPDLTKTPQPWLDALEAAVAAGRIPNLPPSDVSGGSPTYAGGLALDSDEVCSATVQCRHPEDLWDAPDGIIAISFDDGPLAPSPRLYDFLKAENQTATHFMVGQNIFENPEIFRQAIEGIGADLAVHTYTHRSMSSLTNEDAVAELGWTMQIIADSTGGRVPKYWRPPFGDTDNRIRAIAKEVFGLTTVIWNQDTVDFSIGSPGGKTVQEVNDFIDNMVKGPKSPGVMLLEHDLNDDAVDVFIRALPLMRENNWDVRPVAAAFERPNYQNAASTISDDVTPFEVSEKQRNRPTYKPYPGNGLPPAVDGSRPPPATRPPPSRPPTDDGPTAPAPPTGGAGGKYVVKPGDTCEKIAAANRVTTEALMAANSPAVNDDCTNLLPGQTLVIPGRGGASPAPAPPTAPPVEEDEEEEIVTPPAGDDRPAPPPTRPTASTPAPPTRPTAGAPPPPPTRPTAGAPPPPPAPSAPAAPVTPPASEQPPVNFWEAVEVVERPNVAPAPPPTQNFNAGGYGDGYGYDSPDPAQAQQSGSGNSAGATVVGRWALVGCIALGVMVLA